MEVNEALLAKFICAECTRPMHPPIRVCSSRHNFCDQCAAKAQWCPVCKRYRRIAHNIRLETFYDRTIFPCRNHSEGCSFKAMGPKVKEHEEFCEYSLQRCPLKAIDNCKWTGKTKEVIGHCQEDHPRNTYCAYQQTLMCSRFLEDDGEVHRYYVILQAYGELFRLMWDIDYTTGMMKWRVAYLGPKEEAVRYYFELDFGIPHSFAKTTHLRAVCQPFEERELFYSSVYLLTYFRTLRRFCKNGALYYTISLYSTRRDLPPLLESFSGYCSSQSEATTKVHENDPKPCKYR